MSFSPTVFTRNLTLAYGHPPRLGALACRVEVATAAWEVTTLSGWGRVVGVGTAPMFSAVPGRTTEGNTNLVLRTFCNFFDCFQSLVIPQISKSPEPCFTEPWTN